MHANIILPSNFTAQSLFAQVDQNFGQLNDIPQEVTFDFSKLSFVRPSGVVFLSNFTRFLVRNGCRVNYTKMRVDSRPIKFLDDSLFFEQHFGEKLDSLSSPRATTQPLLEVRHSESHDWTRNTFVPWLSGCTQIQSYDLGELATCLSELFNNIDDHTEFDVGSIFAQWYPKEKRVIVAVADFGVGIPATVERVCPSLTDNEAIIKAFEYDFTSQSTPRNRGIGLGFLCQNVVDNLSGKLEVNSARGAVAFKKVDNLITSVPYTQRGYCPGTLIVLEFDTTLIEQTEGKREDIQW